MYKVKFSLKKRQNHFQKWFCPYNRYAGISGNDQPLR